MTLAEIQLIISNYKTQAQHFFNSIKNIDGDYDTINDVEEFLTNDQGRSFDLIKEEQKTGDIFTLNSEPFNEEQNDFIFISNISKKMNILDEVKLREDEATIIMSYYKDSTNEIKNGCSVVKNSDGDFTLTFDTPQLDTQYVFFIINEYNILDPIKKTIYNVDLNGFSFLLEKDHYPIQDSDLKNSKILILRGN